MVEKRLNTAVLQKSVVVVRITKTCMVIDLMNKNCNMRHKKTAHIADSRDCQKHCGSHVK